MRMTRCWFTGPMRTDGGLELLETLRDGFLAVMLRSVCCLFGRDTHTHAHTHTHTHTQPIIDVSEAGSAAASPIHPIQEEALEEDEGGENEGGLAGELAAFMKKKKARKQEGEAEKDTRGSFKKRWSLKRKSREKKKESTSSEQSQAVVQAEATQASTQQETQQQNDVQRPVTNSGGEALQGEPAGVHYLE